MSNRGAAVLGVRLLALYLAVEALLALPRDMTAARGADVSDLMLTGVVLPLCIAAVLWLAVGRFADALLPARRGHTIQESPARESDDLQVVVFAAVGLFLLADNLPEACLALWRFFHGGTMAVNDPVTVELFAAAGRAALGLVVFLGARGASGLVYLLRNAGRG